MLQITSSCWGWNGTFKSPKKLRIRLDYQETALNSFSDVANALISKQKFDLVREQRARSVDACQRSVSFSLQCYAAGKASYFEVLDAQIQLYPEQNALAQTDLNRRLVVVQLYLALGGGWNLTNADWQKHTVSPVTTNPPSRHP